MVIESSLSCSSFINLQRQLMFIFNIVIISVNNKSLHTGTWQGIHLKRLNNLT